MPTKKSQALKKGYQARDPISHRTYNRATSLKRFEKTGNFTYRGTKKGGQIIYGLGHAAGEKWGKEKGIAPDSTNIRYSKNSPSFDEGVEQYKRSARSKALSS